MPPNAAAPRVRGVQQVSRELIMLLATRGALPPSTDFHGPNPLGRLPSEHELTSLTYWISGPRERPTAYMAVRRVYVFPETRDYLEIVGIEGSLIGTGRLMAKAIEMGLSLGWPLIGDLPRNNPRMRRFIEDLGFREAPTTRMVLEHG